MQRGQKKSETGIDHLKRNDFIIQKQENKKKQLQEEVNKAAAEKEEVEAEVEAAKTEVANLWKEHDYLTSATLKQVADWFVWLASTLGRFFDERSGKAERNANELRRADHEVHDIADGRYDGRIQKFQQGLTR